MIGTAMIDTAMPNLVQQRVITKQLMWKVPRLNLGRGGRRAGRQTRG